MFRSKNLELQIVDHCNLDCVGCSHESPLMPRDQADPVELRASLLSLWRVYRAPVVKLLGGEPLLHTRLPEVIDAVRSLPDVTVRLVTNGLHLGRNYRNALGVDEVHISSYPGVAIPSPDELEQIAAELGATISVMRFDTFRWHRAAADHDDETTQRVFDTCLMYGEWQCHLVRQHRFYPCPAAGTWGDRATDGVDLLDVEERVLAAELARVLGRTEPLESCRSCLGSVGKQLPHQQGWRRARAAAPLDALDLDFVRELERNPVAHNGCWEPALFVDRRR